MNRFNLVALYVRVSTDKQVTEGYSLEAQETVLRDKAISDGKVVYKVYSDAGLSGAKTDRPGLVELLKDAERGLFGSVYVWSIDRVARKLRYLWGVIERLIQADVGFLSVNENIDISTQEGKFLLGFMGSIAQNQRDTIRKNCMLGSRKKAQAGKVVGGNILGYKRVLDEDDPQGGTKLVIEEKEADVVRKIFELYCSGYGLKATVSKVNTIGMRSKNGKKFSLTTIRTILTNKAYIGMVKYGGEYFQGIHEPIIDRDVWDKAQSLLKSKGRYSKIVPYKYMLSGLIKCPICGWGMLPTHAKRINKDGSINYNYYYTCGQYMNKGVGSCTSNVVKAQEADTTVIDFLTGYLSNDGWKNAVLSEIRKKFSADSEIVADVKHRKSDLEMLKAKRRSVLLRYEDGDLDREDFLKEFAGIKIKIEQAEKELKTLEEQAAVPNYNEADVIAAFGKLPALIKRASEDKKLKLLHSVVKAVFVNSDRKVSMVEVYLPTLKTGGVQQTLIINLESGD